jgi:2-polyprenyl-3-methyl-5-hydroxy-6-metoxy-1,4-benzoquinol methylase
MDGREKSIKAQFNALAESYGDVKGQNLYYYETLISVIRKHIEETDSPVLEIGSGAGGILAAVSNVPGIGIDLSEKMVSTASKRYPEHNFRCQKLGSIRIEQRFKTVLLPDVLEYIDDLDGAFSNIRSLMDDQGRLILTTPNPGWFRILNLATRLGLKMKDEYSKPPQKQDVMRAAKRHSFHLASFSTELIFPRKLFGSGWLNDFLMKLPVTRRMGVMMVFVFEAVPVLAGP